MRIIFGVSLVVLCFLAVEGNGRECPTSKPACPYTMDWNPVCSTIGCTYSNLGQLVCAGEKFWYDGECIPWLED